MYHMCPIISAAELGEDVAPTAVSEGEYDLRIVAQKYGVSKAGNAGLTLGIRIEGTEDAPLINMWMGEPTKGSPEYKRRLRDIQNVLKMFGWDMTKDFDLEHDGVNLIGLTGRGLVGQE